MKKIFRSVKNLHLFNALNMNQFAQTNFTGQLDLQTNPNVNVFTARLNPSSSATVGSVAGVAAGTPVKLVDLGAGDQNGVPEVDVTTVLTDYLLGVVISSTKDGIVPPGNTLQVASVGAVVWMNSAGALSRGFAVIADYATPGNVMAVTGKTGTVFGVTLDKATGANQLIRIAVLSNGSKFGGTVSS